MLIFLCKVGLAVYGRMFDALTWNDSLCLVRVDLPVRCVAASHGKVSIVDVYLFACILHPTG